jgi:hypothetical protein
VIGVVEKRLGQTARARSRALLRARRRETHLQRRRERDHPQRLGRLHRPQVRKIQNDAGELVMRAVDWEPSELSLVPIGADPGAGVRSDSQETYPCVITYPQIQTREATMENNTETTKPSATELARVRTIHQLCQHNKLPESFELRLIGDGATVAEARAQILDELAKRSATTINGAHLADLRPSGSSGQESNREVQLMAEALHARFGGPAPSEEARQFYGMRVTDIARWALERRGISTTA